MCVCVAQCLPCVNVLFIISLLPALSDVMTVNQTVDQSNRTEEDRERKKDRMRRRRRRRTERTSQVGQ